MNTSRVVVSLHQPLNHSFTPGLSSLCGVLQLSFGTHVCRFGYVCVCISSNFLGLTHTKCKILAPVQRGNQAPPAVQLAAFTIYISQRVFACSFWTPTGRSEEGLANDDLSRANCSTWSKAGLSLLVSSRCSSADCRPTSKKRLAATLPRVLV